MSGTGKVYLVGAGPGDPGLITLKGWMALREADTVIYDRLTNRELLKWAREDANLIEAGKTPGGPSVDQEEICRLLVRRARMGETVLRLKNGDPFIFGRGFEEALHLARSGVDFEIIPGASSATAVPACAGIPLTHRGLSRSVAIITGHTMEGDGFPEHKWDSLAKGCDTLVILMGSGNLERISEELRKAGIHPERPAAAITWGTTPREKVVFSSLGDLPQKLNEEGIRPPVTLVIGETVGLGDMIRPYMTERPLYGKRVLILRNDGPGDGLRRLLSLAGAFVLQIPAIRIEEGSDVEILEIFGKGKRYDWVVFTSKNAVYSLFHHLQRAGLDARTFGGSLLCAIGPGTARALADHHLRADVIPKSYSTRGVLSLLQGMPLSNRKILLVRSNLSNSNLKENLQKMGAEVKEIHPYRAQIAEQVDAGLVEALRNGDIDVVLLTSPSTVTGLMNMIGKKTELLEGVTVGCIGPVTAKSARKMEIPISFRASRYSDEGLVRALIDYLKEVKEGASPQASHFPSPEQPGDQGSGKGDPACQG